MNRAKEKGFSLLDALVSLVVLSIGFLMILALFPVSGVYVKNSENRLLAKQFAEMYIELYSHPRYWDEISNGTVLNNHIYGTEPVTTIINGKQMLTNFSWEVGSAEESPGELYSLTVRVTWREGVGKHTDTNNIKQIELSTIVLNPN